jgi:hypothetical protein
MEWYSAETSKCGIRQKKEEWGKKHSGECNTHGHKSSGGRCLSTGSKLTTERANPPVTGKPPDMAEHVFEVPRAINS